MLSCAHMYINKYIHAYDMNYTLVRLCLTTYIFIYMCFHQNRITFVPVGINS